MAIRAKFRVNRINNQEYTDKETNKAVVASREVVMNPVYSHDPESENHRFWKASPSGTLSIWINNPAAYNQFEVGQEYYLDFTLASGE